MLEHDPPVMWGKAEQSMLPIKKDQERPIKRARTDPEKPSHATLPYQRKKYGRNGHRRLTKSQLFARQTTERATKYE